MPPSKVVDDPGRDDHGLFKPGRFAMHYEEGCF